MRSSHQPSSSGHSWNFSLFSSLFKGDPQRPRSRRPYSWRETDTEHLGLKRRLASMTTGLGQRSAACDRPLSPCVPSV